MTANHLEHKIATFPGSPGGGSTGGQARGQGGLGEMMGGLYSYQRTCGIAASA